MKNFACTIDGGKTVYDNTNGLTGWDGTRDGEQVPPEVYGYYMVVRLVGDIPNDPDRRKYSCI